MGIGNRQDEHIDDLVQAQLHSQQLPALESDANQAHLRWWGPSYRAQVALVDLLSSMRFGWAENEFFSLRFAAIKASNAQGAGPAGDVELIRMRRPGFQIFRDQAETVAGYARRSGSPSDRDTRAPEIFSQVQNLWPYWSAVSGLDWTVYPAVADLLDITMAMASHVSHRFKHALVCPRPIAYTARVAPMLPTPAHGTLPMGHATESFAVAEVLKALLPSAAAGENRYDLLADRIAFNRVLAGVHFPIDLLAGRLLGMVLGRLIVACETPAGAAEGQAKIKAKVKAKAKASSKTDNPGAMPGCPSGAVFDGRAAGENGQAPAARYYEDAIAHQVLIAPQASGAPALPVIAEYWRLAREQLSSAGG